MFLLFGFSRHKSNSIDVYDENGGRYAIFYIGNCFSLFFIPLFNFSKVYFIQYGMHASRITREEYHQMKSGGKVPSHYAAKAATAQAHDEARSAKPEEGATYGNEYCPVCKSKLEENFAYCPFCGQKQPKKL